MTAADHPNPHPTPHAPGAPAGPPLSRLLDSTADAVQAVRDGRSLTEVLARTPGPLRPGTQALASQVLRRLAAARAVRQLLAPKAPPPRVDALLLSALALLWPDDAPPYPDHTLVDQAVTCARQRAPAAANFINAVLRRFLRERDALVAGVLRGEPEAVWNHPAWWITRLRADWPTQWQAILGAAQQRPPMVLRVNARIASGAAYLQRLADAGLTGAHLLAPQAIELAQPVPVERLPGFAEGHVSVQDLAAQHAAPLLLADPLPAGARVLDACAAPGGKTAHLLELADLDVLALDADAQRLPRVVDTLHRLRLQAATRVADARDLASWWDGQPFDAVLLDAPCSASGIVRRHPDIRWLRRPEDITALARTQAALLEALWGVLKPGGVLVYATCSVFKAEGQDQIDAFLQRHGPTEARLDPRSPGHLLPVPDNGPTVAPDAAGRAAIGLADGFYYARVHKTAPAEGAS